MNLANGAIAAAKAYVPADTLLPLAFAEDSAAPVGESNLVPLSGLVMLYSRCHGGVKAFTGRGVLEGNCTWPWPGCGSCEREERSMGNPDA